MSMMFRTDPMIAAQVVDLVLRERTRSKSPTDWSSRIANFGYSVRRTDTGRQMVTTLPHGVEVCMLPPDWAS